MLARTTLRTLRTSAVQLAKGDKSTIDLFRLPSQTSINDWEFKYDYVPKVATPKTPAVTKDAVRKQIVEDKVKQVEQEIFNKEANQSVLLEGSGATVIHGGELVAQSPVDDHAHGNPTPIDSSSGKERVEKKSAKNPFVQSLLNPNLNNPEVVVLGDSEVDHKTQQVKPAQVVDDLEHDNLKGAGQAAAEDIKKKGSPVGITVASLLGLGGVVYYFQGKEKK